MNSSTYIFGELSGGYSQYPEDSSSNLFKDIQEQCVAPSQLIIHRDGNMMYYIYVRKFDKSKYIGFAIAINGYYFTQIKALFSLFEEEIEKLVETGVIINLTDNGEITSGLSSFTQEEEEVMYVVNTLQIKIDSREDLKRVPPIDYSVAISAQKLFKDTDADSEIANASYRFGFTIVLKEEDYDSVRMTSFKNILKNLNANNKALIKENKELREYNNKIQRQKKQIKNVIFLTLIVIACGIGLYLLNENLNNTQDRLDTANIAISEKESIIENNNSIITNLQDSVTGLQSELENAEESIQSICSYTPFAVTSCETNQYQFKFKYFSLEDKEVTLTLKAIGELSDEIITSTSTVSIHKGTGSQSLNFHETLDNSQYYYVVLIYNGHIIAGEHW